MRTSVQRRYSNHRAPEYKFYNDQFDKFLILSHILNSENPIGSRSILWDRASIEAEIDRLTTKLIPDIEKKLQELTSSFNGHCEQQINMGRKKPERWPKDLLEPRLKFEAFMDITKREIEVLKDQLNKRFIEPIKQAEAQGMLKRGPLGVGEMRGGILIMIDGQACEKIDGVMVITSEKSPYNGMAVSDYREYVSKPWIISRRKRNLELEKMKADEIRKNGYSNIVINLGNRVIDKSSLPPWPNGVQNLLMRISETEEVVPLRRAGKKT
jgi:hypothetical protein